ncbi:subtilisin-like serine protease [Halalkaliarchaeum desulfuricum]|uniref:Subtilisin-like serine protease n=1 Tax=Halalkaliarchaeum desulfuricum TaxID=2055893 RepID=A0A343TLJ9_9EURY|nr:S8 family serine peptidase [Halalkaliarchaeum desulfuricum]AUX09971.1 subtilisin-like serine protease [Halalkaliarchaeum desulfuricum]
MSDGHRGDRSDGRTLGATARVVIFSAIVLTAVLAVPPAEYTRTDAVDGTDAIGLAAADPPDEDLRALHDRGVTGEGVKIGIVGSSFGSYGNLGEGVAERERLHDSGAQPVGDSTTDHGAQVASVVAGSAPDAELYLAELGDGPESHTYRSAIAWLVDEEVDVILDAGSYAPTDRGTAAVFGWAAEYTSQQDVLFVTSAGNYGNKHWAGTVEGSGWIPFDRTTEANEIGEGTIDGPVSLRLYWESDHPFELYLFKHRPDARDVVVASASETDGAAGIDATVPEGSYYAAVRTPEEVAPPEQLRLFSLHQPLAHTEPHDSVLEPASTGSVLAVGATTHDELLRADSSRHDSMIAGPGTVETAGGEVVGTSAAAPYVAGTAALLKSADGSLSSDETRELLFSTAERNGSATVVDPANAVSAVEPEADITDRDG